MADMDAVFKAYDIRGIYPTGVDEDLAWKVGNATAQFLRTHLSGYDRGQASANRLVVGRDMRTHSEPLAASLIEGIVASGAGCVDIGMVDTPMIYFAVNHLGTCGGIQVTASHNPPEYNGFKISGQKARPIGENTGLKEIKHIASKARRSQPLDTPPPIQKMDLWKAYGQHVRQFLKLPRPLKVVVDASNGMAGKMIPAIFGDTDLEIIPLNFEITGSFVHPPNPLVEANLQMTKDAVVEHAADFGVCFDGDADRCMFVDESGRAIGCDLMTALLARHFLRTNPGATVVYDLRSSRVVPEEILAAGGVPRRERVGHAFMKKALADAHGVFGGELSGHFYFRDNFNADSGAIVFAVACSVIAAGATPLGERIAPLNRYAASGEINFQVADKAAVMNELVETFSDAKIDRLDGITLEYEDWWCNVRPSNTEPLLRLNLEAATEEQMRGKLKKIESILGKPVAH
ncbi:MAG: phosphomannomutase/phosphoglucomutase [Planctomycetes bacterium]|nr:phosphomannomutase/phosphoglucomutase [Planctomycetota bacterium]